MWHTSRFVKSGSHPSREPGPFRASSNRVPSLTASPKGSPARIHNILRCFDELHVLLFGKKLRGVQAHNHGVEAYPNDSSCGFSSFSG